MRNKMKKRTIFLIVFFSLILITTVGVWGYKKSEILSIEASFSKMPQFPVVVYFIDKPNVKYVFTDRNANMWIQLSPDP